MAHNNSSLLYTDKDNHIFDIPHIRALLIVLYTIVFILCCVGNLAVVLVVILHSRMRNLTKFLLGNLSFANLCVGMFCVYQSMTTYLYESWFYGDFMCKMHHFTQSLCHTASILVLVAIAVERYLVLLHPFKSRQMMTLRRLAALITILWISSAAIASPRLYYFGTIKIRIRKHHKETICIPKKKLYDSAMADTIYFVLLYVFPLTIISVLYARIAKHLHRSVALRRGFDQSLQRDRHGRSYSKRHTENSVEFVGRGGSCIQAVRLKIRKSSNCGLVGGRSHRNLSFSPSKSITVTERRNNTDHPLPSCTATTSYQRKSQKLLRHKDDNLTSKVSKLTPRKRSSWPHYCCAGSQISRSSSEPTLSASNSPREHILETEGTERVVKFKQHSEPLTRSTSSSGHFARHTRLKCNARRIQLNKRLYAIRVLVVTVVTFAVLNLPFHVRKLCLNYLPSYDADSDVNHLLTPLTFLLMYANCAISPILYAFLSKRFRQSFLDLIFKRKKRRRNDGGHAGRIRLPEVCV